MEWILDLLIKITIKFLVKFMPNVCETSSDVVKISNLKIMKSCIKIKLLNKLQI